MIHFNKKKLAIILSAILVLPILFTIYFFYFFELTPGSKDLLASFALVGSKYRIEIYSFLGGATAKNNIQVQKIDKNGKRSTIRIIENYSLVKRLKFLSGNSFEVVLGDDYSPGVSTTDTVFTVNLSDK